MTAGNRRNRFVAVGAVVVLVGLAVLTPVADATSSTKPTTPTTRHFVAPLSGHQEVPPVATKARGVATFRLSRDGSTLTYRINVARLDDVTMAHIHLAPAGQNGPVVAWLYPADGPPPQLIPGRTNGRLVRGTLTAEDLTGPLAGATMADLLAAMRAGDTYVNVHTTTYPAGEIRGQIR
jgi:hypothetical protein